MKVLLVIAHVDPNRQATAYRLANAAKEALLAAGNEVQETDLIHEGFDRCATPDDFKELVNGGKPFYYSANQHSETNFIEIIQKQHEMIKWSTHIIVFAPMWMYRLPACFYAWFERVFSFGFAYDYKHTLANGFLAGRKVSFIITFGGTFQHFAGNGYSPIESCMYATAYGFRYSGIKPTRTFGYFSANNPEVVEKEAEYIEKFKKAIVKIDSWPLLPSLDKKPEEGKPNDGEILAKLDPLTIDTVLSE